MTTNWRENCIIEKSLDPNADPPWMVHDSPDRKAYLREDGSWKFYGPRTTEETKLSIGNFDTAEDAYAVLRDAKPPVPEKNTETVSVVDEDTLCEDVVEFPNIKLFGDTHRSTLMLLSILDPIIKDVEIETVGDARTMVKRGMVVLNEALKAIQEL